jgi:hypothetical protein
MPRLFLSRNIQDANGAPGWAPDDSGTALRVPLYGGATRVPLGFADPVGQEPAAAVAGAPRADAGKMSLDSAFWVWNLVANLAYGERYDLTMPVIRSADQQHSNSLLCCCADL